MKKSDGDDGRYRLIDDLVWMRMEKKIGITQRIDIIQRRISTSVETVVLESASPNRFVVFVGSAPNLKDA